MNTLRSLPVLVALTLAVSTVIVSCGDDSNARIAEIDDSDKAPTMLTTDVSTYVSDSGYTRYHITAPLWIMYEEADTPFWTFPEGMHLEKFDDDMNTDATFRADSATYLSSRKIWRFDGNVNMRNTDGDRFATPQLFWDQNTKRVYSDSFMHIVRAERIIEGYGFESNEAMTEYTILHPQMILPIDRMKAQRDERRQQADSAATGNSQADTIPPPSNKARPSSARPSQRQPGAIHRPVPTHNDTALKRVTRRRNLTLNETDSKLTPLKAEPIKK